jgi:plastocyanin
MVFITRFIGAAAALTFAAAIPAPQIQDSGLGELAVSAPNGIPLSDTATEAAKETTVIDLNANVAPPPQVTPPPANDNKQYYDDSKAGYAPASTYTASSYGSGSSKWGGSGYDDCVQKCVGSYGDAPYEKPSGTYEDHGKGATHTVIVAPTQGVLRYVPFALNASVGDTIKFVWGANNHTVTKGSALLPCNKTSDNLFTSGVQNKGFEFTQVVNSTEPTYFFCNTPTHCQKGMFGIINPRTNFGAATSVGLMAPELAAKDADLQALWDSTSKATEGNYKASAWGSNFDSKDMPDWSHEYLVENTLYVRQFLALNKDVLKDDGSIDLSNAPNTPLMYPQLSVSGGYGSGYDSPPAAGSSPAATTSSAPSSASAAAAGSLSSGASSLASPKIFVGLMAVVVTLLAL